MRNHSPLISVILPVYNGAAYLKSAIESILTQSFDDLELIIMNDGSTDASEEVVREFQDNRIRYFYHKNKGLAATLNRGIELARGEMIARQDQDDLSSSDRLLKQMQLLKREPDIGMAGTWARIISSSTNEERYHKHPANYPEILIELLFDNPFVHSSMVVRKRVFDDIGGYTTDTQRQPPEDYELWSRVARKYRVRNVPEVLQFYREVASSMSNDPMNPFDQKVRKISLENIAFFAGTTINDPVARAIAFLGRPSGGWNRLAPSYPRIEKTLSEICTSIGILSNSNLANLESWKTAVEKIRKNYYARHFLWRSFRLLKTPKRLLKKGYAVTKKLVEDHWK